MKVASSIRLTDFQKVPRIGTRHGTSIETFVVAVPPKALGSMGTPIKMTVGGHDVYICCEDCAGKNWKAIGINISPSLPNSLAKSPPGLKNKETATLFSRGFPFSGESGILTL